MNSIEMHNKMKKLKYTLVFPINYASREAEEKIWAQQLINLGYDITSFGIHCQGNWWPFPKLNKAYQTKYPLLLDRYETLRQHMETRDVLISKGGSMLHPDFISKLPCVTAFQCSDDPESSEILSKPVAAAFDLSFVYNVACLDTYKSWGCKHVYPMFFPIPTKMHFPNSDIDKLTKEDILNKNRTVDIAMFCERVYGLSDRAKRIGVLVSAFPTTFVAGKGWPKGYVSNDEMCNIYLNTKIGWNLHNSLGPCNIRTTLLPAMGVMQICDNKQHLGWFFELDKEVVGFDSISECIEKTQYYLEHDDKRREIAANGFVRATTNYSMEGWMNKITEAIYESCQHKLHI